MRAFVRSMMTVSLAALTAAGCATTRAEVPRERPALDVPMPPPRVITPLPPPETTPAVEPVGALPGTNAPTPARPRPQKAVDTAKPDPKPEEAKPDPNAQTPTTPLVPQLRTPEVGNPEKVTALIRDTIGRTRAMLEKIDYGPLSEARKKQYDDAKLFANQAEQELKSSNLVAAKELAEKAERLAKELQGR